jgi:hypothetical protein
MAEKSLAVIVVRLDGKDFRLNTISASNDGTIHVINNFTAEDESTKKPIQHKYTYHQNGYTHFTEGEGTSKEEIFPKKKSEIAKITDTVGLSIITLQKLKSNPISSQKEFIMRPKYKHVLTIDGSKYNNLTIRYFLAHKDFDTNKSANQYTDVFEVPLSENKIIIGAISTDNPMQLLALHM